MIVSSSSRGLKRKESSRGTLSNQATIKLFKSYDLNSVSSPEVSVLQIQWDFSRVPRPGELFSDGSLTVSHFKSVSCPTINLNVIESGTGMWTSVQMVMFLGGKNPHTYGDVRQKQRDQSLTNPSPQEPESFSTFCMNFLVNITNSWHTFTLSYKE